MSVERHESVTLADERELQANRPPLLHAVRMVAEERNDGKSWIGSLDSQIPPAGPSLRPRRPVACGLIGLWRRRGLRAPTDR